MNLMEIKKIKLSLDTLKDNNAKLSGKLEVLQTQQLQNKQRLENLQHNKEIYAKSVEFVTMLQKSACDNVKKGFETIVSYALKSIYGQDYDFAIEIGRRGNYQELDFNIKTPQCQKALNPLETSGGGVLDGVSLALRVALLELSSPKIEGPLLLDESFKHISTSFVGKASNFLKSLAQKLNRQIIMVSHRAEIIESADNKIEVV